MTEPAVAVVIPVYNGADFVGEAVASAYGQSVPPQEVIVVNDGSTDRTNLVLSSLEQERRPGFMWQTIPHSGSAARPRNVGIAGVTSPIIAFLDADDVWHPSKVERQLAQFEEEPELDVSFTAYNRVTSSSSTVVRHEAWDPDPMIVLHRLMRSVAVGPPSTVMIRRSALERLPAFDERVGSAEDWKMWLDAAATGLRIGYLDVPLVDYRWHGGNVSSGNYKHFDHANKVFELLFEEGRLPATMQRQERWWRAHWHLLTAVDAIQHHDRSRARRHVLLAARLHPFSIRPGWIRMLGIGPPPNEVRACGELAER